MLYRQASSLRWREYRGSLMLSRQASSLRWRKDRGSLMHSPQASSLRWREDGGSLVHSCCQNQRIGASSQAFVLGFAVCNVFESEKQYGYRMLFTILLDWEFDLVPSLKHVFYHNPIFNEPYKACCSRNWNNKPPFDTFDRGCCLHKAQREISVFIVIYPRPLELQGCFSILAGLACYSRYFSHRATHDISITEVH